VNPPGTPRGVRRQASPNAQPAGGAGDARLHIIRPPAGKPPTEAMAAGDLRSLVPGDEGASPSLSGRIAPNGLSRRSRGWWSWEPMPEGPAGLRPRWSARPRIERRCGLPTCGLLHRRSCRCIPRIDATWHGPVHTGCRGPGRKAPSNRVRHPFSCRSFCSSSPPKHAPANTVHSYCPSAIMYYRKFRKT